MEQQKYDIAIVGCGPAGMSAALNAEIRAKQFVLLGTQECAGKLEKAPQVENYLGLPDIAGSELRQRFFQHLQEAGVTIEQARITAIYPGDQGYSLVSGETIFQADSVIICTGVSPTDLIPGEAGMIGKGASYCATCDGPLFRGKKVAVIAFSTEAEEEAAYLAQICDWVYYLSQYATVGDLPPNVEVRREKPKSIAGTDRVTHVELDRGKLEIDGVFILRDTMPAEQLLQGLELKGGAIMVDRDLATNLPGVFAAGDCTGKPWQISKAVGEGATAALNAVKYVDGVAKLENASQQVK